MAILAGIGAGGLLAIFVLALYAVAALHQSCVLAGGDIQLYFYAYWEYVAATLREGRLPFWNPYLFLGVPLLANPQTAVLIRCIGRAQLAAGHQANLLERGATPGCWCWAVMRLARPRHWAMALRRR